MITLAGGLGNQLFQLSASIYIESKYFRDTFFNISNLKKNLRSEPGNYTRNLEIAELIKDSSVINSKLIPLRLDSPTRLFKRLRDPNSILIENSSNNNILAQIDEKTISVYGYFQSSSLVNEVWPDLKNKMEKSNRFSFLLNSKKVERIAIHIRFGDYSDDPNTKATHGLTKPDYYFEAISLFKKDFENNPEIIVITDDVMQAKKFLETSENNFVMCFISSPDSISDLGEIARSTHVIMSNSTFSWWAAWLAYKTHSAKVIYPRPWFSNSEDPDLPIYEPNWIPLKREYFS